jgi:predicted dehydrogenase
MDLALVGLGYWGEKLLRNLVAVHGAERVIAVDTHLDAIERAAMAYPGVRVSFDVGEVLASPSVGAVAIATPAATHASLAIAALEAGLHVLVEKPMATTVEDALAMQAAACRNRRVLMVGHTFLFSPRVRKLRALVQDGSLGRIHHLSARRLNLGTIRPDANVIWDLAPHDFSIVFHLLGERPCLVQTTARHTIADAPEVAFVNLTFPSGVIASVAVSWLSPRKVRDVTVVGADRMAIFDDTASEEPIRIYDRGVVVPEGPEFGAHQLTYRYGDIVSPFVSAAEPLAIQIEEFLAAIGGAPIPASGGDFGLDVVGALDAADRSWREGGASIELDAAPEMAV